MKLFCGKPMIGYAISAALASGEFDRVIVSTDDHEIADISLACGAEVPFSRPSELADDHTPTVPVIAHAIRACQSMGWIVNEVCCIYPCVPFISTEDLKSTYQLLQSSGAYFAFPVANFPSPIQRALRRLHDGSIVPFQSEYVSVRSQDLEQSFFDVGQFYWGRRDAWLDGMSIHLNSTTLVIPEWRSVDIDTTEDWNRAELMFRCLNNLT
jgi:pseudaminic acid cytidylyltransferase